jgi:hypothetical protein
VRPEAEVLEQLAEDRTWQLQRYDANNELGTLLACVVGMGFVAVRLFLA